MISSIYKFFIIRVILTLNFPRDSQNKAALHFYNDYLTKFVFGA